MPHLGALLLWARPRLARLLTVPLLGVSAGGALAASPAAASAQTGRDTIRADSAATPYLLEPVIVTATRSGQTANALAVATNLVGRESVRERPARLLTDLLAAEPGILVQQTTAGQGAPLIRALTGSQILLMIDGVRLNNGTFRQGPSQYLSTVDPETVERIEVVRGASSTLYGSDAIGGVVNVLTRRPANLLDPDLPLAAEASFQFDGAARGTRARLTGAARVSERLSVMGGGSYLDQGDLRPGGGLPRQDPTGFQQWGVDFRADWEHSARWSSEWAFQHAEQEGVPRYDRYVEFRAPGTPGGGLGRSYTYLFGPQDRTLARARLQGRFDSQILSALDLSFSYQRQEEGRTIRGQSVQGGVVVPRSRVEFASDAVSSLAGDLQARAFSRDGRSTVTYGAELWTNETASFGWVENLDTGLRTPEIRMSNGVPVPTGRFPDGSTFDGGALYAFLDQYLSSAFRVQAGARGSAYWTSTRVGDDFGGSVDSRFTDLSGEVGVVWEPREGLDLRLRGAQAFRAPNIYDLTLVGDVPGGIALPGNGLGPEQSITLEAGVHYVGRSFATDVTVYRLTIEGVLDRVFGTFQGSTVYGPDSLRVLTIQNTGDATVRGIEASLSAGLPGDGNLDVAMFYTHGDADVGRDGVVVREPMSRVPPTTVRVRTRWPFEVAERAGWVEYEGQVSDAQRRLGFRDAIDSRIQPGGTPSFHVHSVRVGADLSERAQMSLGLLNVFDELYRVHGSGIDAPGRHVFVRLDVQAFGG